VASLQSLGVNAIELGELRANGVAALEGLTEGLYYELKPLNIELRLIEQGGSKGNNFLNSVVFNTHPEIKDYDDLVGKVNAMFSGVTEDALDDPQMIVDEIHALATGESQKFRTLVGQTGNDLMALRNAVPIEEYLAKIALNFA
jgi:hypothetical protein